MLPHESFGLQHEIFGRTAMLPFYRFGKAHVSATNPKLFRRLLGIHVELFLNSSALLLECNGAP